MTKKNRRRAKKAGFTKDGDFIPLEKKVPSDDNKYPAFSFKFFDEKAKCHKGISVSNWSSVLHDLFLLSKITWDVIYSVDHCKNGFEKIERSQLRVSLPVELSTGTTLYCFRIAGQNGRMIGYREDAIFQVLFLDFSPFVVYRH